MMELQHEVLSTTIISERKWINSCWN